MEDSLIIQSLLSAQEDELEDQAPDQEEAQIENNLSEAQINPPLRLDYKLKTCAERAELVNKIIEQTPQSNLTARYLEILGDYIMGGISAEEKKEHLYLTDNRLVTINKRETSFEGLAEKFENGADGIYNLMVNDKNIIFQHHQEISAQDIENIPGLKQLKEAIDAVEEESKHATGRRKYLLKKQLIEMRKDQYILKGAHQQPLALIPTYHGASKISLNEERYVDAQGNPRSTGLVTLFNADHISAILRNYSALAIETSARHQDDFFYLMSDFDDLLLKALAPYPMYLDIVRMKVANKTNVEIQAHLVKKYNTQYSIQYISSLWCNKIPKLLAEKAQNDYLMWYYKTEARGPLKKCAHCGQEKPANSHFFSRNSTSKDGWYSICKCCRNKK